MNKRSTKKTKAELLTIPDTTKKKKNLKGKYLKRRLNDLYR